MTIQLQDLKSTFTLDSKGLKLGASAAIAGIGAVVAGIGIAVKATMDWANDLDALGDVMDGTNKDFAALAFVARKSGVGVETLTKANVILNKGLLKVDGTLDTVGKALKKYGIDVKDVNDNTKDTVQLTDEIAKKYAELGTQQERINFLTEIYGKSGAQMVDFFDTLNSDGGISAVTKKVQAFGLAIDPDRYEKFNRNLEELKLIGLGLAVSFTEKVMPVLEGFLDWLNRMAQNPRFQQIAKDVGKFFADIPNMLKGLKNFNIDDALQKAMDFAENINWEEVGNNLAEGIAKIDWHMIGTKIGDFVMKMLEVLKKIGQILWTMLDGAIKGIKWSALLDTISRAIINFIEGIAGVSKNKFVSMLQSWGVAIGQGISGVMSALSNLRNQIENKLREIAKQFFNRAVGWGQQMILGFSTNAKKVLDVISGLVSAINAILKKIVTSFGLSFSLPGNMGGASGSAGGGSGGSGGNKKRASGANVIGGQSYQVLEGGKPEIFTPNTSGRVDPMREQRIIVDLDYNKLARSLAPVLLKIA